VIERFKRKRNRAKGAYTGSTSLGIACDDLLMSSNVRKLLSSIIYNRAKKVF
jgi:hypothetical protein